MKCAATSPLMIVSDRGPCKVPTEEPVASPAVIPIPTKKAGSIRAKHGQMTFLTPEETLAVLKAARERSTRDWAMILLAYRHGLRASEVCGLKLADVDLKAGSVSIRRLKGSLQTVQPLYQHRGQPLLDETTALRAWLRKRPADGSDYLFTSQKGGKLDRTQFFRVFQTIAKNAGLPVDKRHPHVLKHSLASHLIAGNVNLALVRQALGHRSINSTMQYVGTSDRQAADAAQTALMNLF
jgi:integrase